MSCRILFSLALVVALLLPAGLYSTETATSKLVSSAMDKANAHDYTAAYADFDKAIKLEPKNAFVFGMRGVAKQIQGDFNGSIADLRKSLEITPVDLTRFYLTIALRRMRQDDAPAGLKVAVKALPDGWKKTVGAFLLGDLSEKDFLAAADQGDASKTAQQKCEALYYAGMARFFKFDMAGAKELLTKCTELKLTDNIEDMLARGELARMTVKKP